MKNTLHCAALPLPPPSSVFFLYTHAVFMNMLVSFPQVCALYDLDTLLVVAIWW